MFDGIALETRCQYCPEWDSILGLCCEHSPLLAQVWADNVYNIVSEDRTADYPHCRVREQQHCSHEIEEHK